MGFDILAFKNGSIQNLATFPLSFFVSLQNMEVPPSQEILLLMFAFL